MNKTVDLWRGYRIIKLFKMGKTTNLIVSGVSGLLFAAGWWIFIDGSAYRHKFTDSAGPFMFYLPGILATIGLFILNNLDKKLFQEGGWGDEAETWEKILIVISVMLHLAAIIACIWVYAARKGDRDIWEKKWQGISSIIQTFLIVISSCVWRFLWKDNEGW